MNIYDIANLAGVSIATVSRVVNDSPKVSEKTKEKVRKIMEEHNYIPNVFARGLGLGTMKIFGIVCPDVSDPYMAKAVSYLENSLQDYGYDCILYCSGYDVENKQQAVENIFKKQIDALILVGSDYADDSPNYYQCIHNIAEQLPVFLINGYLEDDHIYCVFGDDFQAIYDVTDELLVSGKKQILFLANSYSYSAKCKLEGYKAAISHHGLLLDEKLILYAGHTIYATRDMLLRQRNLHFDSVIATNDSLAVGVVKYAHARGIQIPEEINVIGYNNSELAISCEPELTSIDNRVEILCKTTIDSVIALLNGKEIKKKQIVKCHLIKRNTTNF